MEQAHCPACLQDAEGGRVGKDGVRWSKRDTLKSKAFVRRKDRSDSKYSQDLLQKSAD